MIKASNGARIGAYVLDGLFMWVIILLATILSPVLGSIAMLVTMILYYGISEGSNLHASPGKHLCGLMVVDENGMPLTYGQSFLRAFCKLLSGIIFGIGYLIGLFDENGKTLHDRIAGTRVVVRTANVPVLQNAAGSQVQPIRVTSINAQQQQQQQIYTGMDNPQMTVVTGTFMGRSFPVSVQGIVIGRDQTVCNFVVSGDQAQQGISRMHCRLQFDPQTRTFILYDLGSSYGTFLGNGVSVTQDKPGILHSGDEFYLASRETTFRVSL